MKRKFFFSRKTQNKFHYLVAWWVMGFPFPWSPQWRDTAWHDNILNSSILSMCIPFNNIEFHKNFNISFFLYFDCIHLLRKMYPLRKQSNLQKTGFKLMMTIDHICPAITWRYDIKVKRNLIKILTWILCLQDNNDDIFDNNTNIANYDWWNYLVLQCIIFISLQYFTMITETYPLSCLIYMLLKCSP